MTENKYTMKNHQYEKYKIYMKEYLREKYNTDDIYKEYKKQQNNCYYHQKKCEKNQIYISNKPKRINFN